MPHPHGQPRATPSIRVVDQIQRVVGALEITEMPIVKWQHRIERAEHRDPMFLLDGSIIGAIEKAVALICQVLDRKHPARGCPQGLCDAALYLPWSAAHLSVSTGGNAYMGRGRQMSTTAP